MAHKSTRRDRNKARHRAEILNAAAMLFANRGYNSTPMVAIAEAADFAVGTLYRFFKDKSALREELIQDTIERFCAAMASALSQPAPPLSQLDHYLCTKESIFSRSRDRAVIYVRETSFWPQERPDLCLHRSHTQLMQKLEAVCERGIDAGTIFHSNAYSLALTIEATSNALVQVMSNVPSRLPQDTLANLTLMAIGQSYAEHPRNPVGSHRKVSAPAEDAVFY